MKAKTLALKGKVVAIEPRLELLLTFLGKPLRIANADTTTKSSASVPDIRELLSARAAR